MIELKGNKGEWSEVYVLLKTLADGIIYGSDEYLELTPDIFYNILKIIRFEKKIGIHEYKRKPENIIITNIEQNKNFEIGISKFTEAANMLIEKIRLIPGSHNNRIPEIEDFLRTIKVSKLTADSNTKSDIKIQIHDVYTGSEPQLEFSIKSQLGAPPTLLNASKATNFKYKLSQRLSNSEIEYINNLEGGSYQKINYLNRNGVELIFEDCINSNFKYNLQMIDYKMPEIISSVLLVANTEKVFKLEDIFFLMRNNLAEDDLELYKHKFKQLLMSSSLGMMPNKKWSGNDEATGGYIVVKFDGTLACFHLYNRNALKNYLFMNTKFENGSRKKHNFGKIYSEDDTQFFNLNLQIRFTS